MWARAQCVEAARPMLKVKAHGATLAITQIAFYFWLGTFGIGGRLAMLLVGAWPRNVSIPVTAVFLYQCTVGGTDSASTDQTILVILGADGSSASERNCSKNLLRDRARQHLDILHDCC